MLESKLSAISFHDMKNMIIAFSLVTGSQAASIGIIYNTCNLSGGALGIKTSTLPIGFASPAITDVVGSPIILNGLTEDGNNTNGFTVSGVPTTIDLSKYLSFTLTPATGVEFSPSEVRVAMTAFDSRFDGNAAYEIRTSQDNFTSSLGTSARNNNSGRNRISGTQTNTIYDISLDVSSLAPTRDALEYRLYFTDDDGVIDPRCSTSTFLYGFQFFGATAAVPEPSSTLLALLGSAAFFLRRR
jgi:hypothetical protein